VLVPNEVQGVRHENSIDRWKDKIGILQIPDHLANFNAIAPLRNFSEVSRAE
jgi:hypothetical protein